MNAVFIPGVGACKRELVTENVTKVTLEPYYSSSGFEALSDWWNKIVKINPGLQPLYLYRIEVYRRL